MLQREQLQRVAKLYAEDVAELRSFLVAAGVDTCRADSLPRTASLLASNHAFRRDLLSHIYLIRHGDDREMRYADLLGTLALAAAGPAFAAAARAQDAHDLLRFLMEARTTLEDSPYRREHLSEPSTEEHRPQSGGLHHDAGDRYRASSRRPTRHHPTTSLWRRKRKALVVVSIVAIVAVGSIVWRPVHSPSAWFSATPSSTLTRTPSEPEQDAAPEPRPAAVITPSPYGERPARPAAARQGAAVPASLPLARPARTATAKTLSDDVPAVWKPQEDNAAAAPIYRSGTVASVSDRGQTTATPQGGAVPTAVLSQRLGSRTLPTDYSVEDNSYDSTYPKLLRRRPLLPLAAESSSEPELVASNEPPTVFRDSRRSPASNAATTVRPVSLGIMAGNILYSPAPVYPAAAAAAHVQGEVKVQAEVDRDGNVASARVISGPPLLRDAAVDAVQRWRYRPYLSAGKPVAMSATAVVDFQLQ